MTIDSIISGGIENRKRRIAELTLALDLAVTAEDWKLADELKDLLVTQIDVLYTLKIGTKVSK